MRRILPRDLFRLVTLALLTATGCTDRLPTLADSDRLPADLIPTTLEYVLDTADFLTEAQSLRGTTNVTNSNDLVVARAFDDSLFANVLAEFPALPDTIWFNGSVEVSFTVTEARFVSAISDTLAASLGDLNFFLWTISEPWDTTATWEQAESFPNGRDWQEPGGTRGDLLGVASWSRISSEAGADSLAWVLSPQTYASLVQNRPEGLMVTIEDESARAEIEPVAIRLTIVPFSTPDTTITRTIFPQHQTFVLTPDPPEPVDVLRVGGLTSDRTLLRLHLPTELPGCAQGAPVCAPIAVTDVSLNRVDLVFDPVPVTGGFRPTDPVQVTVRRRFEPDLGLLAPLGAAFSGVNVRSDQFEFPGGAPVHFIVTAAVGEALANGNTDLGLALSVEPEASTIAYAWLNRNPRLRFIYTLPQLPQLP